MTRLTLRPLLLAGLAATLLVAAPALAGSKPTIYKTADYATPKALHKAVDDMFDTEDAEKILKAGHRKVAIVEFAVEFVSSSTKKGDGGLLRLLGEGKQKIDFDEDYKKALPNTLYDEFVKILGEQGIAVVPKESVQGHALYEQYKGTTEPAAGKGQTGKGRGALLQTLVYPAAGFKVLEDDGDNEAIDARLLEALDAPLSMRVHVRLNLYDKVQPTLEQGSYVQLGEGVKKKTKKKTGEVEYDLDRFETIPMTEGLRIEDNVVSEKEFKTGKGTVTNIDTEKFQGDLMQMYPTFCQMIADMLINTK